MLKNQPKQLKLRIISMKDQGFTHKKILEKTGMKIKTKKIVSIYIKHKYVARLKSSEKPKIF